jgi:hypothetical protein
MIFNHFTNFGPISMVVNAGIALGFADVADWLKPQEIVSSFV